VQTDSKSQHLFPQKTRKMFDFYFDSGILCL